MPRKIIQISVSSDSEVSVLLAVALCDDGTAWKIRLNIADSKVAAPWVQLPALPDTDCLEQGK